MSAIAELRGSRQNLQTTPFIATAEVPENTRNFTSRGLDRPEISENILNLALGFFDT